MQCPEWLELPAAPAADLQEESAIHLYENVRLMRQAVRRLYAQRHGSGDRAAPVCASNSALRQRPARPGSDSPGRRGLRFRRLIFALLPVLAWALVALLGLAAVFAFAAILSGR